MSEDTIQKQPHKKSKIRRFLGRAVPFLLGLLVILLALTSIYFYRKSTFDPNAASQAEVTSLVKKVGKLIVLPIDETPTVATVSDPAALKDQAFFAEAKKGDKVLIYSNAKKAVLYDPVANKVITIAPLNVSSKKEPVNSTPPENDSPVNPTP